MLRFHATATASQDACRWLRAACRGVPDHVVAEAAVRVVAAVAPAGRRGGGLVTLAVESRADTLAVAIVDDAADPRLTAFRVSVREP